MGWRTPHEEFDSKYTIPTVKQGDDSVMVWTVSPVRELENCVYWIVS